MKAISVIGSINFISSLWCRVLLALAVASSLMTAQLVRADDTSADAPSGFGSVIKKSKGVLLRVPVNAQGEENTNAAEMRFYQGENRLEAGERLPTAWDRAVAVDKNDEVVLGKNTSSVNPADDSSTWGWYHWHWNGWMQPFYYYYYVPTFYYYNFWYSYPFYSFWNFGGYRYYYYCW
jgi:hypothetical protein